MEFLTTKQLAKILGVKTVTIRRWIDKGELSGYKFGKELRVEKQDFEKFISLRKIKP
ncbi:MAG: helix-turn-helix domain-containing protein [bacterium]